MLVVVHLNAGFHKVVGHQAPMFGCLDAGLSGMLGCLEGWLDQDEGTGTRDF